MLPFPVLGLPTGKKATNDAQKIATIANSSWASEAFELGRRLAKEAIKDAQLKWKESHNKKNKAQDEAAA